MASALPTYSGTTPAGLVYTAAACSTLPTTSSSAGTAVSGAVNTYFTKGTVDKCTASTTVTCEYYQAPVGIVNTTTDLKLSAGVGGTEENSFVTVWSLGTGGMTCKQISAPTTNLAAV